MKKIKIFNLAVRNLRRKFVRTFVLLLIVAVVTGTLFGATVFISGMRNALKIGTYRLGADILVVPEKNEEQAKTALLAGEPTSFYMDKEIFNKVKAVEGVKKASPQLFIKPASFTCCYTVDAFLIAFDPETDFTITPWLEKKLKKPLVGNEVIAGRGMPIIVGDSLPFFGTLFEVVGTMDMTGMKFFDQSIFMTTAAAYSMAENSKTKSIQPLDLDRSKISAVLVQVGENYTPGRVAIKIEHDVDGVKAIASDEVINAVRKQLGGLLAGILAISSVLWILALMMMGFAFYMIVNERQREIGLLRAMGGKKQHIFKLIISEALVISLIGGLIGLVIGAALLFSFKNFILSSLRLPYLLPSVKVLIELVSGAIIFSAVTGLLASLMPAISASRMEPYEAIRKGE